ncbi:hypothetical protein D3C75_1028600 [compost metagenome]
MTVRKFKMGIPLLEFVQQLKYPKTAFTHVGIVHDNHGFIRELRQPAVKVVAHRFKGM